VFLVKSMDDEITQLLAGALALRQPLSLADALQLDQPMNKFLPFCESPELAPTAASTYISQPSSPVQLNLQLLLVATPKTLLLAEALAPESGKRVLHLASLLPPSNSSLFT
jgi:hypothetical protein